jgi:hypothetical protein
MYAFLGNSSGDLIPGWSDITTHGDNIGIGDFNSDNTKDLATFLELTDHIKIFDGDGVGGFFAPDSISLPFDCYEGWVTNGDMNNDGNMDIVFGFEIINDSYYGILLNNGTGGFFPLIYDTVSSTSGFERIEAGLLNSDNIMDLVIFHDNSKLSVLMGLGNSTYSSPVVYTTPHFNYTQIVLTHMDYDPYPDICLNNGSYLDVYYGTSTGAFLAPNSYFAGGTRIAVSDLNGDWMTDYAVIQSGTFYVHVGDGNRNFQRSDTSFCTTHDGPGFYELCAPDVDNDGLPELMENHLVLLKNTSLPPIITSVPNPRNEVVEGIMVYPNPADQNTTLQIEATKEEEANVQIFSVSGELLNAFLIPLSPGNNKVPLDVSTYQPGLYILQVQRGEFVENKSVMVY